LVNCVFAKWYPTTCASTRTLAAIAHRLEVVFLARTQISRQPVDGADEIGDGLIGWWTPRPRLRCVAQALARHGGFGRLSLAWLHSRGLNESRLASYRLSRNAFVTGRGSFTRVWTRLRRAAVHSQRRTLRPRSFLEAVRVTDSVMVTQATRSEELEELAEYANEFAP